jgi:hypothetical protein
MLLVLIVLILIFGAPLSYHGWNNWGHTYGGGIGLGTILLIILVLILLRQA